MSTKNENQEPRQASQYDKIFKENLDVAFPVILKELLGIEIIESEDLPDTLQHTKERKPDKLTRVTDIKREKFVLHLEVQATNEAEMIYREADYHIMLTRKYHKDNLPIQQFVLYLGEGVSTMISEMDTGAMQFRYNLISISTFSYKLFYNSEDPEVIMLGLLGNFGDEDKKTVIRKIVNKLQLHTKGDLEKSKYFIQLRTLAILRKSLAEEFKQVIMDTITSSINIEEDFLYQEGMEKGWEKGVEEGMEKGWGKGKEEERITIALEMKKDGIPAKQISKFTKLSIEEIEKL
jgi:predicted transposase/invertase (TIGR01784 family)